MVISQYLTIIRLLRSPGSERRSQREGVHGIYTSGFETERLNGRAVYPEVKEQDKFSKVSLLAFIPATRGSSRVRKHRFFCCF